MKHIISSVILAAAMVAPAAAAPCIANDAWTGPDKSLHFVAGGVAGSVGTLVFKSPKAGFWTSVAVAGLKEAYDASGHGTCSLQDFAVTVAGGAVGSYSTAWFIAPRKGGVVLGYVGTFK